MSSRILRDLESEAAEPLLWRPAARRGDLHGDAEQHNTQPPPEAVAEPSQAWEEYGALEAKLAEMESQIREQRALRAASRDAEVAASVKWEAALERVARTIAEVASLRARLRREAEDDVVRLSMAMAKRILRRELTMDREALLGLAKAAMERLDMRETHRVRVRPEDAPLIAAYLDRIGSPHRVEVVPDPALERGGLVFETQRGQLDASVETQLEEIERGLADLLERRREA